MSLLLFLVAAVAVAVVVIVVEATRSRNGRQDAEKHCIKGMAVHDVG